MEEFYRWKSRGVADRAREAFLGGGTAGRMREARDAAQAGGDDRRAERIFAALAKRADREAARAAARYMADARRNWRANPDRAGALQSILRQLATRAAGPGAAPDPAAGGGGNRAAELEKLIAAQRKAAEASARQMVDAAQAAKGVGEHASAALGATGGGLQSVGSAASEANAATRGAVGELNATVGVIVDRLANDARLAEIEAREARNARSRIASSKMGA